MCKPTTTPDTLAVVMQLFGGSNCYDSCLFGVVDFSKEVLFLVVISVLLVPQSKDEPMSQEQNSQYTRIIDTKPFVGTLRSDGGSGGKDGGHGPSDGSYNTLANIRDLHGHRKSTGALGNTES